jgi:Tol biopolymer transport system component
MPARDALLVAVANAAGVQRLGVVPLNGSAPIWVKEFEQVAPESLTVSADGRYVAFDMIPEPGNPARDIHVLDLDTRMEWPLVEHPATDLTPIWAPHGRTLVFSSDRLGTMGMWKVPTTNGHASGEPILVRDLGRSVATPRGFTDDGALFYGLQTGWFDVYVAAIDLDRGTVGQPVRISPRPLDQNAAPDWSFNGDRIAYASGAFLFGATPGSTHIVVKERATNTERLLPHQGQIHQTRLRWSPDARLILKGSGALVSADTGETVRKLPLEPGSDGIEWSHAGDRIFSIVDNRILSTNLSSSATTELHRVLPPDNIDEVVGLAASPDDRWLTFTTYNSERHCAIHLMPADGGPPRERVRFDQPCSGAAWSPDGGRLVFSVGAHGTLMGPSTLWTVDMAAGEARPLPLTMDQIFQIRFHPNGREILFTSGSPRTENWLLEGFLENSR